MSDGRPDLTLEELRDFLQHPGWRWFSLQVAHEWGDAGFGVKVSKVVANTEFSQAGEAIRQLTATKAAVDRIITIPRQKLESLKQADDRETAAASPSRRPVRV
jgi:hypothetical protein